MSLFNRLSVTVKKQGSTFNTTTGKYTITYTERAIKATIQPADPETLEMLPEFDKAKKHILIVTGSLVEEKEILVYRNEDYRIIAVDDFTDMGLIEDAQYQAIGVRNV